MSDIAEFLRGTIKVYGYTARKDLNFKNISNNMTVNGSNTKTLHNRFIAVNEEQFNKVIENDTVKKCFSDCNNCNHCKKQKRIYNI